MRLHFGLHSALLASLVLLALGASACGFKLGDKTDGDKGKLTFEYAGPRCFFGCGLEKSALQGSLVSITARGGDPNVRMTARIDQTSIARIATQLDSCTCNKNSRNESTSRSIDSNGACASDEQKSCAVGVGVETSGQGDAKLEILDPNGAVVDSVTIRVRPAARIDVTVTRGGTKNGDVYDVQNGSKVALESRVYDAHGDEVVFTEHGVSHDYGDTSILAPNSAVLFGSTDVEDMIARSPGDTTVKAYALGAEQIVRFHVVQ